MPLLWLSLAYLAGVLCGRYLVLPVGLWFGAAAGFVAVHVLVSQLRLPGRIPHIESLRRRMRKTIPLPLFILIAFICLGAGRFQTVNPTPSIHHLAYYNDIPDPLAVSGTVVEPPDVRDTFTYIKVSASGIRSLAAGASINYPVHGGLLARIDNTPQAWQYGDEVEIHGLIQSPPHDLPTYRDMLAARGIFSLMPSGRGRCIAHRAGNPFLALIYNLKKALGREIYRLFPDPEASLLAGILLGEDANIPQTVQQAFRDTGTSHIIAISGFNMTIVAALFAILCGRIPGRWKRLFIILGGIVCYAILVGGSASVLRAALMSGSGLLAKQLGRRQDGVNTLGFTAALLCIFNPWLLWDVGFQLSATATLGMLLYAEPFSYTFAHLTGRLFPISTSKRFARWVGEYFLFTLAAQVVSFPVILFHFHQISLSALIVNPLVLPVQPAVMILGGISTILGLIFLPLGQAASALTWPFLLYTIRVVEFFSAVFPAIMEVAEFPILATLSWYGFLIAVPHLRLKWKKWRGTLTPGLLFILLMSLTVFIWQALLANANDHLEITILNSGGTGGLYIHSPGGKRILVDGGAQASLLNDGLGRRMPALDRHLDVLLLTGASKAKVGALLRSARVYSPRRVFAPPDWRNFKDIQSIRSGLGMDNDGIETLQSGQEFDLGDGTRIAILLAKSNGMLLLIEREYFRALVSTCLETDFLQAVADYRSPVTLLYLSGNGSEILDLDDWKAAGQINLLAISALLDLAADDRKISQPEIYPHILRAANYRWIRFSTDGRLLWITTEKR